MSGFISWSWKDDQPHRPEIHRSMRLVVGRRGVRSLLVSPHRPFPPQANLVSIFLRGVSEEFEK